MFVSLSTPVRTGLALTLAYPLVMAQSAPQQVEVTSQRDRLDAARNGLSPDTGSSVYRFDETDIARLPLGDATPLNQVILQAPGVAQDSYGQLHVRGDHSNLQYRIDGVVIPESISGFGQALETRFANQINLLTGALPAQYGYRTAGVIDIRSKGQAEGGDGGRIELLGGTNGHREGSLELGGKTGKDGGQDGAFSYYLSGSALEDDAGIENPTASRRPLHDRTRQGKGFGYFSYLLGPDTRVNLMLGASGNRFQIPDVPGQTPTFTLNGSPAIDSSTLDARQKEGSRFSVLSLQSSAGPHVDYQVALFHRDSRVHYTPDPRGDLLFDGVAADVNRVDTANGLQADLSWRLDAAHTVRGGLFLQAERARTDNRALVFPADADGNQTSDQPLAIVDDSRLSGHLWGAYLQDEWQPWKGLTVNYGLRYDQAHTVVNEHQLSPRIGMVYDFGPNTRVHAGYARYFTPPPAEKIDATSVRKFAGTTNALPSDANTAVRSERSDYYDLGVEQQFGPHFTLGLDGYYRRVRHLQDEGQFGNALIFSAFNFARGRIYGLELSANYRDDAFAAYANLALARAFGTRVETGQFNFGQDELDTIASRWVHLDHDQATSGSAGVSYRWRGGLTTSADLLAGSGLRNGFANTGHLPGYAQVNLSGERSVDFGDGMGLGKLDLRLSLVNAFDRVYQIHDGSGIGVGAPQYGPRRGVLLGVSKKF